MGSELRRYGWMAASLFVFATLILIAMPRSSGTDLLIWLKETNQEIAPAAIFCPNWSYPPESIIECTVEGGSRRIPVQLRVTDTKAEFVNEADAQEAIDYVTRAAR